MNTVEITKMHTFLYILGCLMIGIAVPLVIRSEFGTSPWDTLHVAINQTTPITIGMATIVVAGTATAIVIAIQKRLKYILMIIPIIFVGALIDFFDLIVFADFYPENTFIRGLLFLFAIFTMPLGGALLVISTYPAGVFDELMLALMKLFKVSNMAVFRILMDFTALMIAVMLTLIVNNNFGSLTYGTIIFILAIGPLLKRYLVIIRRLIMKMNKYIDHTYLKAFGTKEDIDSLLEEALTYDFKSVCVNPTWVEYAAESLKRSDVLVCTVIGFPLGASTTKTKVFETEDALKNGADEIDMVINIGWIKAGRYDEAREEIKTIKDTCGSNTLKVILETCYLTDDEIKKASEAAFEAGADFVKTSTGFGSGGATVNAVKIMADVANGKGVKASGGIKTREDFDQMIDAGATRIGASSGVSLMKGETSNEDY